jgi:hypothetical protein
MTVQTQSSPAAAGVVVPLDPFLRGDTGRNTRSLLRIIILCTIAAAGVASRLFSVIRRGHFSIFFFFGPWRGMTSSLRDWALLWRVFFGMF